MIQRYILGFPYDSLDISKPYPPYYGYWADANGDGVVSAQDLTDLRKVTLGVNTSFNPCRIISKYCLENYTDPYYYDGYCLDGCQWVDFFSPTESADFYLFHIGDVNNTFSDPDCTKPFQQEQTEIRSKFITLDEYLEQRVNFDRSVTVGFNQTKSINMLGLSIEVGDINYEDLVFHVNNVDNKISNGILYISYFSDGISDGIEVKDLFSIKHEREFFEIKSEDSYFIEQSGKVGRLSNNIVKYIPISNKSFVIHENDGNIVIALNQVLKSEEISYVTIYNTE